MCAAKRSVETGQPLRDACRNRPEGGPQRYSRFAKKLSAIGFAHRLTVLSLDVRADAITRAAVTAAAADAAPAADDKGVFAPPCPTTSPLPAAFCNILHRFSKLSSGEARASVNETCPNCQHGVAWFKSVQMRSADEGKAVVCKC